MLMPGTTVGTLAVTPDTPRAGFKSFGKSLSTVDGSVSAWMGNSQGTVANGRTNHGSSGKCTSYDHIYIYIFDTER